jgi:ketosteroid isomerase-like protein
MRPFTAPAEGGDMTMGEHANATVIRQMMDAMGRGDMQAASDALADDVVWHEIGRSEPRRGKAELQAAMSGGASDYTITAAVHDILASDDHVVALVDATATRGGAAFRYRTAEICHVRNGKIVERWAFSDDTAAIVAFFA